MARSYVLLEFTIGNVCSVTMEYKVYALCCCYLAPEDALRSAYKGAGPRVYYEEP